MIQVLDTSAVLLDFPAGNELITTREVIGEIKDTRSRLRLEVLREAGLREQEPSGSSLTRVDEAARRTGDVTVLSPADRSVIALALDVQGVLVTDDFAVQNVAYALEVPVLTIGQRRAHPRKWRYRCTGCGRYTREPGECPVCGAEIKRTLK